MPTDLLGFIATSATVPLKITEESGSLADLARSYLHTEDDLPFESVAVPSKVQPNSALEPAVQLSLDDLVHDESGEIVIECASDNHILLGLEQLPTSSGTTDQHQTMAGDDVSGMSFMTFESGLTLYYMPDTLTADLTQDFG